MRRVLSLRLLCLLALFFTTLGTQAANATNGDSIVWYANEDGSLYGTNPMYLEGDVVVPCLGLVQGYGPLAGKKIPLTKLGSVMFNPFDKATSVSFEEGSQVEVINGTKFPKATSISLPPSLKEMKAECSSALERIVFPENSNLKVIEGTLGYGNKLSTVTLPASLERIGDRVFLQSGVKHVKFGEGSQLKEIGKSAFDQSQLETIELPEGLTSIGERAFWETKLTAVSIPASVTSIGGSAFYRCDTLSDVTLDPHSQLTTIGPSAFAYSGVTAMHFPASVETIDKQAFYYCQSLATVDFASDSKLKTIGEQGFFPVAFEAVELPASLESVGKRAFSTETGPARILASVKFREGDGPGTVIGEQAFKGQTSLRSVELSKNVVSLGKECFSGCKGITSFTIPEDGRLQSIGNSSLMYCEAIDNALYIPASVETIGESAFRYNKARTQLVFAEGSKLKTIDSYAFADCEQTANELVVPASVERIGAYAFFNCKALPSLKFESNSKLKKIGSSAFYNLNIAGDLQIPAAVDTIEHYAFQYCSKLTSLGFGANSQLTTLGNNVFASCKALTAISIPATLSTMGNGVFNQCTNLETVIIKENEEGTASLQAIPANTFSTCAKLRYVYLPSTWARVKGTGTENIMSGVFGHQVALPSYAHAYGLGKATQSGNALSISFSRIKGEIPAETPVLWFMQETEEIEPLYSFAANQGLGIIYKEVLARGDGHAATVNNSITVNGGPTLSMVGNSANVLTLDKDKSYFVLVSSANGGTKFARYPGTTLPAGKAALCVADNSASEARSIQFVLEDDEATGVDLLEASTSATEATYNLQGQRVKAMTPGKIYIVNGNKMMAK